MRHIRRLVYRLGFRPKPGSIFYSPTLHFTTGFIEAYKTKGVMVLEDAFTYEVLDGDPGHEPGIGFYLAFSPWTGLSNQRSNELSSAQELKDAAVTLRTAFDKFVESDPFEGLGEEIHQLKLSVEYLIITIGHATDCSYDEVLEQGECELPLTTDAAGDRVWSEKEE